MNTDSVSKRNVCYKGLYLVLLVMLLGNTLSCKMDFDNLPAGNTTHDLTSEEQLQDSVYLKKIDLFYDSGNYRFFEGKAGIPIHSRTYLRDDTAKAVVISSGRTEAAIKYKELIYDLYKNGYSVYIHDHRGQGLSGRMTADPQMGYVDDFQHYVDDMKFFYENYVKPNKHKAVYLLAHSMGGAIGMTYLEQFTKDFTAAAFSSPMLGLNPPICSLVGLFDTKNPEYAIGESKYKDDNSSFEGNELTGSRIRYNLMINAYAKTPEARLGGATYSWIKESCDQFDYLFDNIDKIAIPFILFSAQKEEIVSTRAHRSFITKAKEKEKNCMLFNIPEAHHELFIEKDLPRQQTLNTVLEFFSIH